MIPRRVGMRLNRNEPVLRDAEHIAEKHGAAFARRLKDARDKEGAIYRANPA